MKRKFLSGLLPLICGVVLTLVILLTLSSVKIVKTSSSFAAESDTTLIYLPVAFKPPVPPLNGAAIGYTGAWNEVSFGPEVFFPSFRKDDSGWDSTVAIQNISVQTTSLTLLFFRQDGTIAYSTDAISLQPYGTYIASASDFSSLSNGFYAVAATASENIVGMVSTLDVTGAMGIAYNGANQGSQKIVIPWLAKDYFGRTSRLCLQNPTDAQMRLSIDYFDTDGTLFYKRMIDLHANGFNCFDLTDETGLPANFRGTALVNAASGTVVVTVEDSRSTGEWAQGYLGFDLYANTRLNYIPLCRKTNGRQTNILFENVGSQATDVQISLRSTAGVLLYVQNIAANSPTWGSALCHTNPSPIIPSPWPINDYLGSAVLAANQSEIIMLVSETSVSHDSDGFSYRGLSDAATIAYVPNIGHGLNLWKSTLTIQNAASVTNSLRMLFYDQAGTMTHELLDEMPPYGMKQYEIDQLPELPNAFEGSAVISGTHPIAVLVSKER